MARKEFHFDFNEDADPVEELHRLRVAATKHFKTMKATLEFLHSVPTAEEFLTELDTKAKKQALRSTKVRNAKNTRKSVKQQKPAKRLTRT